MLCIPRSIVTQTLIFEPAARRGTERRADWLQKIEYSSSKKVLLVAYVQIRIYVKVY
jgi:hypothetical protein